jgi:hypothetical protein
MAQKADDFYVLSEEEIDGDGSVESLEALEEMQAESEAEEDAKENAALLDLPLKKN